MVSIQKIHQGEAFLSPRTQPKDPSVSFGETLSQGREVFRPPAPGKPELYELWETSKQFEVNFMTTLFEELYVSRESNTENEIFAAELSHAVAEQMVETGTEIASSSIARQIYEDHVKKLHHTDDSSEDLQNDTVSTFVSEQLSGV